MANDTTKGGVPRYKSLMNPTLRALRELGGSGTVNDLLLQVTQDMALPRHIANVLHVDGPQTELEYYLAWARTCLKAIGLIDNPQRGVWTLTPAGHHVQSVDPSEVMAKYHQVLRARREAKPTTRLS